MEQLLFQKLSEIERQGRIILAIDGLSRAGKTTIVKTIKSYFERENRHCEIFHIDNLIVTRKERYNTGHEQWFEYYNLQWDIQWLVENFFSKLREANSIELPYYDDKEDQHYNKNISLPENCVVVIEGVFLQRKEWRKFYDYKIYLDCPREVRFKRESLETQKNVMKFKERYWKAEEFYLQQEHPIMHADLIIRS